MEKVKKLILIVGSGRTGTSLLLSILGSHSKIEAMPETGILRCIISSKKLDANLVRWSRIQTTYNIEKQPTDIYEYERFIDDVSLKKNSLLVVDKDPRLVEYLPQLKKIFKEKLFLIFTYRDPKAIIASKMRTSWSKKKGFWLNCLITYIHVRLTILEAKTNHNNSFHFIEYSKLISLPTETLKGLCNYLGIKYEKDMMQFQNTSRKLVFDDEISWKSKTFEKLDKNADDNWKRELSIWQINFIDYLFSSPVRTNGISCRNRAAPNLVFLFTFKLMFSAIFHFFRFFKFMLIIQENCENKGKIVWKKLSQEK